MTEIQSDILIYMKSLARPLTKHVIVAEFDSKYSLLRILYTILDLEEMNKIRRVKRDDWYNSFECTE